MNDGRLGKIGHKKSQDKNPGRVLNPISYEKPLKR